jgi:hypothetical protein
MKAKVSITIKNHNYIVPNDAMTVSQCKRGFWFYKSKDTALLTSNIAPLSGWVPEEILLQSRDVDTGLLKPLRTEVNKNWQDKVYYPIDHVDNCLTTIVCN